MPQLEARKLYKLIKQNLIKRGIKGRVGFFTYLRSEELLVKPKKSFIKTTFSKHWMKKHPNLLREEDLHNAEHVLVSDITYLESDQGVPYLSLVTDSSTHKIMGHHLSLDMRDENVVKALKMALKNKQYVDNSVHRSDTGLQYCSAICQNDLKADGIQPSMIDGYDCYQNALVERIKGIPKQEFLIYRCKTVEKLKILVAELLKFTVKLGRTLVWT